MEIEIKKKVKVKYLKMEVAVRYKDEDIAFDAPMRKGDVWSCIINLDEKRICDWPIGKSLSFKDMKICDEGSYKLLDEDLNLIVEHDGYVPNNLLPGDYGDYLSLEIDSRGVITNWLSNANLSDFEVK